MQIWFNLVLVLQVLASIAMIGLVLVQHGKGADMGASFGSGASGSLFGATGSANFLSRSTAVAASVFFAATLALALLGSRAMTAPGERPGGTVLDRPVAASAAPASGPSAAVIPTASPAVAPSVAAPTMPSAASAAAVPPVAPATPAPPASR